MFKFIPVIFLFVLLTGCASIQQQPDPYKVNIVNIEVLESTLLEQRYLVTLRIQNRSTEELSIRGMSFDIKLNDKDFASGVSNKKINVSAFEEAVAEVKMSSTLFGWIRQFQSMQNAENKTFKYEISGYLSAAGSFFGTSFHETGEFDFNQDPGSKSTLQKTNTL